MLQAKKCICSVEMINTLEYYWIWDAHKENWTTNQSHIEMIWFAIIISLEVNAWRIRDTNRQLESWVWLDPRFPEFLCANWYRSCWWEFPALEHLECHSVRSVSPAKIIGFIHKITNYIMMNVIVSLVRRWMWKDVQINATY